MCIIVSLHQTCLCTHCALAFHVLQDQEQKKITYAHMNQGTSCSFPWERTTNWLCNAKRKFWFLLLENFKDLRWNINLLNEIFYLDAFGTLAPQQHCENIDDPSYLGFSCFFSITWLYFLNISSHCWIKHYFSCCFWSPQSKRDTKFIHSVHAWHA